MTGDIGDGRATAITRRGLLGGAGAALALAACGGARATTPPRQAAPAPIIVVGAGISGLVIAYRLMQQGHDVRVIEASSRPGGRIRTIRGWPGGLHVEAGATHIVPDPDLVKLLVELGVATDPPTPQPRLASVVYADRQRRVFPSGEDPPSSRAYTADERKLGFAGRLATYFGIVHQIDDRMRRTLQWSSEIAALDRWTCADYLRGKGASAAAITDIDEIMPIGDGVESISALEVARVLAAFSHERALPPPPVRSNGRISGGSDAIIAALVRRLGDRIAYDTVLEQIDRSATPINLGVRDHQGRHHLAAARVVLTMPFPVLRAIAVTPPWSPLKARAIAELGMTSVTRIWVASDRRYWTEHGESGTADSDLPTGRIRDETDEQTATAGVLGIYATGAAARQLAARDPAARIAALTGDVERVHPTVAGHIVHGDSVAWDAEPFARGAYAAFRPGQLTELARAAAACEGAFHFAGCGVSYRPGFLHGALASALRVVDEIHAVTTCDASSSTRCSPLRPHPDAEQALQR
jgi:monoamine oxidase